MCAAHRAGLRHQIDLNDAATFRDLSKPMGCQDPGREGEPDSAFRFPACAFGSFYPSLSRVQGTVLTTCSAGRWLGTLPVRSSSLIRAYDVATDQSNRLFQLRDPLLERDDRSWVPDPPLPVHRSVSRLARRIVRPRRPAVLECCKSVEISKLVRSNGLLPLLDSVLD